MKKTTLNIPDQIYRRVKQRAAEQGRTVSEVVAEYLHRGLSATEQATELPPLPVYNLGPLLVDVADRDALYDAMDRDNPHIQKLLGNRSE